MSVQNIKNYSCVFDRGRSLGVEVLWRLVSAVVFENPLVHGYALKAALLRKFGARVGEGLILKPCVKITMPWKLIIGNHVWIGEKVWLDSLGCISIGDESVLSQGVYVCTGNHRYDKPGFDLEIKPVTLESQVWVGAKAMIGPGVTLKGGSVVVLGAVVTKSTEGYGVYQGNPAQKVKMRVVT